MMDIDEVSTRRVLWAMECFENCEIENDDFGEIKTPDLKSNETIGFIHCINDIIDLTGSDIEENYGDSEELNTVKNTTESIEETNSEANIKTSTESNAQDSTELTTEKKIESPSLGNHELDKLKSVHEIALIKLLEEETKLKEAMEKIQNLEEKITKMKAKDMEKKNLSLIKDLTDDEDSCNQIVKEFQERHKLLELELENEKSLNPIGKDIVRNLKGLLKDAQTEKNELKQSHEKVYTRLDAHVKYLTEENSQLKADFEKKLALSSENEKHLQSTIVELRNQSHDSLIYDLDKAKESNTKLNEQVQSLHKLLQEQTDTHKNELSKLKKALEKKTNSFTLLREEQAKCKRNYEYQVKKNQEFQNELRQLKTKILRQENSSKEMEQHYLNRLQQMMPGMGNYLFIVISFINLVIFIYLLL